jgi:hypothetical protein
MDNLRHAGKVQYRPHNPGQIFFDLGWYDEQTGHARMMDILSPRNEELYKFGRIAAAMEREEIGINDVCGISVFPPLTEVTLRQRELEALMREAAMI